MTFDSPLVLAVGLLLVVVLAVAAVRIARRRREALAALGATARGGATAGVWCTLVGLALLAVAAAGPVATVPVPRSAGTVVLAMDVSGSMRADDVEPTRLAAAKRAARAFIRAQPTTVDIGVVAFEQGALTRARPDGDHAVALRAIDRLRVTGGTSLGAAVLASLSAVTGEPVVLGEDGEAPDIGTWPSATVIVFSDGEDEGRGVDIEAAATVAQNAGVQVETVGVGTAEGATVEVDGFRVRTALDEEALTAIADTTGGTYHPASDAEALNGVASGIDLRLTVADEELPLAGAVTVAALILLVLGAALTLLRSGRLI